MSETQNFPMDTMVVLLLSQTLLILKNDTAQIPLQLPLIVSFWRYNGFLMDFQMQLLL